MTGNFFPTNPHKTECQSSRCIRYPDQDPIDYSVGAPNVLNQNGIMSGVVYLCPNCFNELGTNDELYIHRGYNLKLHGYQFGEKFGQTNLAIDINGDGYDDIVVGAPLHSSNSVSIQYTKSLIIQVDS